MIRVRTLALIIFIAAVSVVSTMAEDLCYDKADPALSKMKTWSDLHSWYDKYLICDDGYFGEGLSEFVTATLSKRWDTIDDLQVEISKNLKLKDFVLEHIDASVDENSLVIIIENTKKKCSPGLRPLCDELRKRAQLALKEMNEN
jgi:hypothetical protein